MWLVMLACAVDCEDPRSALDGRAWDVFVHAADAVVATADGPPGSFPAYQSPGNGASTWTLGWDATATVAAPVSVDIDGQVLDGLGTWASPRCGYFDLAFAGTFVVEGLSEHAIDADATLQTYDDVLQGTLDWTEVWTTADAAGTYIGSLQLFGEAAR